jgi:hypothetical protein
MTTKSFDLNANGIPDRQETYKGKVLVKIEEDRNGDGKFDLVTNLDVQGAFKVELADNNYDTKFERKRTYSITDKDSIKILHETDLDQDGIFEISYVTFSGLIQKQSQCTIEDIDANISSLFSSSTEVVANLSDDYIPTGFGYNIDPVCIEKWGPGITNSLKSSTQKGLSCLLELHKNSAVPNQITGALKNSFELTKILSKNDINVVCSDAPEGWGEALAMAAAGPIHNSKTNPKLRYPFISINPSLPNKKAENSTSSIDKFESVLFHELIHSLGYGHGVSMEYAYTCETCCFEGADRKHEKEMACKLCLGNYSSDMDIEYQRDLAVYASKNYIQDYAFMSAGKILKEKVGDIDALSVLAINSSHEDNAIGRELAKIIRTRKVLTPEAEVLLKKVESYGPLTSPKFVAVSKTSKTIALAIYEIYAHKNGSSAMDILEANKLVIKAELEDKSKSGGTIVHPLLEYQLAALFHELAVNGYPGDKSEKGSTSHRASELRKYLGIGLHQN